MYGKMLDLPHMGHRTNYNIKAIISKVEEKRLWQNFFKKTKIYTLEFNTSLEEDFEVDCGIFGVKKRKFPKGLIYSDTEKILVGKKPGETIDVTVGYAPIREQQSQRVWPFTFQMLGMTLNTPN